MAWDYERFKTAVLQLTGIDLNAYKERQMKRRIDALISKMESMTMKPMCIFLKQIK